MDRRWIVDRDAWIGVTHPTEIVVIYFEVVVVSWVVGVDVIVVVKWGRITRCRVRIWIVGARMLH